MLAAVSSPVFDIEKRDVDACQVHPPEFGNAVKPCGARRNKKVSFKDTPVTAMHVFKD